MRIIKLSNFNIEIIPDSIRREKISDDVYFSDKYSDYISNSRLRLIDPEEDGYPRLYFKGLTGITNPSLQMGTAIHELLLQPKDFTLCEDYGKPSSKLGMVIDRVKYYRKQNYSIYDSIWKASVDLEYYLNRIDSRISKIIRSGFKYYWKTKDFDDSKILLSSSDLETCTKSMNSLKNNKEICDKLYLQDKNIKSHMEDSIFMDIKVSYREKSCILKLKMKADHWAIDLKNKVLYLNDIKTTGRALELFMKKPSGSFYHYHYYRQFAMYKKMLEEYCKKEFGYDETWKFESNVFVVQMFGDYSSSCCSVTEEQLQEGEKEFSDLIKQIAYYTMYGYETLQIFI